MASGAVKLTISLPHNLIKIADEIAREKKISRSRVVSLCLQELADRRLQEKMAEGYKILAREHAEFAEASLPLAHEVLHEWK
jgi:metal-responsive CopG/Arc/MetJ family transcriptional regulator